MKWQDPTLKSKEKILVSGIVKNIEVMSSMGGHRGVNMDFVFETFRGYMGSSLVIGLFLLALTYLFLCENRKTRRILFVYTPIILFLLIFNPLFARIFELFLGSETYFRLFWLLPYLLVLPYTVVLIAEQMKGWKPVLVAALTVALIAVSGKAVYSNPLYSRAENIYHVPGCVVDICDAIEVPGREVMALFPEELILYVRQYSPVVCMPYGREIYMGEFNDMIDVMEREKIDLDELLPLTRESDCHYIVLRRDKEIVGDKAGLQLFYETEEYLVFRDPAVQLVIP